MTVRLGFVGVGGMAQYHINTLKKVPQASVVRVYDANPETAKKVGAETGAEVMDNADNVLDPNAIDAVFICTPQFAREALEETAASRGIHVFAEKPLGLKMDVVRRKEQAIREAGIINSSGYCLRYLDTVQKAKAYLQGKAYHMVNGYRFGGLHPSKWWRTLELSGGHFVDTATHQVDMIRFLCGDFAEIDAKFELRSLQTVDPDATIYDAGIAAFKLQNGVTGYVSDSCLSRQQTRAEVEVYGSDFYLQLSKNGTVLTLIDDTQHIVETSKVDFYLEQNRTFVEAVANRRQDGILSPYADAMRTLQVTLTANESTLIRKPLPIGTL
ncbi:Gfo/Idh/MocA family protein [Paenibacillus sp. HJGM_3]|uniref:Gfo/Idh/MocA family protein n=1 Tax=Paenibacillus sp. HJGM_3 TaxID=3379816 RepID=UPI003858BDA1